MKGKYFTFEIEIPIYNHEIVFFLGDYEDLTEFTLKKFNTVIDDLAGSNGMTFNMKNVDIPGIILIAIDQFETYDDLTKFELLVHEITHATIFIMDNAGIPVTNKNDEVIAYMNGYIIDEALKRIFKKHGIKNLFNLDKKSKNKEIKEDKNTKK